MRESGFAPLAGIRVIEMSHMIMGPSCGMFLAFLGADVVKIEPPGGDKTRAMTGMGGGFFPTFNRGKRSVALDLETGEGCRALDMLLSKADVFVENFRDESLARMDLSPGQLRERYPELIVASCKGFLHGPYENRTALDEVVQMMTGMAYMTGPTGMPLRIGSSANDIMAGLFGACAVMGALQYRDRDGCGRTVRIGLFENCLLLVAQHMVQFDINGTEAPPMPERAFSWPVYDIFETGDGKPLFLGAVTESQWDRLCEILGLETFRDDPRLQTRPQQIAARDWTIPLIREAIAGHESVPLIKALEEKGLPFAPIARPAEMYDDPHVRRPGGLLTSRLPEGGSFRAPGLPFEIDGAAANPQLADVPEIGADSAEILGELGMQPETIVRATGQRRK
ncbi:MAG: CoA transferase [Rhodobacteraceae bacterium]|nr:CoA transferase [Paracoccaceae bacterium]